VEFPFKIILLAHVVSNFWIPYTDDINSAAANAVHFIRQNEAEKTVWCFHLPKFDQQSEVS